MQTNHNMRVVITGGNSGIGLQTARALFRDGCDVVIGCRNQQRSIEAIKSIRQSCPQSAGNMRYFRLDLTLRASVQQFAQSVCKHFDSLDVLINNAGVLNNEKNVCSNGVEHTYMANHFGHFYLTYLLFKLLQKSKQARIINVSSSGHLHASDYLTNDSSCANHWGSYSIYFRSKLANVMFTRSLADKLTHRGNIKAMSLHPGLVASDIYRSGCFFKCIRYLCCCCLVDNREGAFTSLKLCRMNFGELRSGQYYDSDGQIGEFNEMARDAVECQKLWRMGEDLYDIHFIV